MKKIFEENKGITLIALVVTIIVLILLSAVMISLTLRDNGIFQKAKQSKAIQKRAEYTEEINLEILAEQTDRLIEEKEELFIVSIEHRLGGTPEEHEEDDKVYEKKPWVDEIINNLNKVLVVYTKDGYEIFIDFDNKNNKATIREDSFKKKDDTEYTITYNANTGEGTTESQTIKAGLSVKLRENSFTKTNYTFVGWYKDQECTGEKYNPGDVYNVTEDETLYAKWSQHAITIEFNPGTGTGEMSNVVMEIGIKENLPQNTFEKHGYSFAGWVDQDNNAYSDEGKVDPVKDLVLTAQWTANDYTVTLDKQNGTGGSESETATYDSEMPSITVPTRTGYTFGGYYTSTNGEGVQYYTETGSSARTWDKALNTTLYAKWIANEYTVTLKKGNYITAVSGDGTYHTDEQVTVTATLKASYTESNYQNNVATEGRVRYKIRHTYSFLSWSGSLSGNTISYTFTMPGNDVELTASGKDTTSQVEHQTYTKTFHGVICRRCGMHMNDTRSASTLQRICNRGSYQCWNGSCRSYNTYYAEEFGWR